MKKQILVSLLLSTLMVLASSATADEVFEYGDVTVTVHAEPIPDLISKTLAANAAARAAMEKPEKIDLAGDELLLPYYELDTNSADGVDTFFAVRNTTDVARTVFVTYYSQNQVGLPLSEMVNLGPKQVRSFNLRNVAGLQTNGLGFARGYIKIFEEGAISPYFSRNIQGDYFIVDAANNFASGDRMLNDTGFDGFNDLCEKFEVRFFNGGGFDGGTQLTIYSSVLQDGNEFVYSVYPEAGGAAVRTGGVTLTNRSASLPASFLAGTTDFGVIEIAFTNTVGHVSGIFNALGKFSVGVNALCEGPSVTF